MSASNGGGHGFFAGLIIGGLIGAALGILFAPQSGEQTRAQLKGKINEAISLGQAAWEEGKEATSLKKDELKVKLDKVRGKA